MSKRPAPRRTWFLVLAIFLIISGITYLAIDIAAGLLTAAIGVVMLIVRAKAPNKPQTRSASSHSHYAGAKSSRNLQTETFKVASIYYCQDGVDRLAREQPEWSMSDDEFVLSFAPGKRLYRYTYINKPVELVPEPTNTHDRNAIMVFVAGEKVGYISSSDNVHVLDILRHREIKYISSFFRGGSYKFCDTNNCVFIDSVGVTINVRIGYV